MPTEIVLSLVQLTRRVQRAWLTRGGVGGDITSAWHQRLPAPPDPPPDPGQRTARYLPSLTRGGFGGDHAPWKQPLPRPPDPEPHRGDLRYGHRPALTRGGYGGDHLDWAKRLPPLPPDPEPHRGDVLTARWGAGRTAVGYGGDHLSWAKRLPPLPPDPPPHPGDVRYGHRPTLTRSGYGGDHIPWDQFRRTPDADPVPGYQAPSRGWVGPQQAAPLAPDATAAFLRKGRAAEEPTGEQPTGRRAAPHALTGVSQGGDALPWRKAPPRPADPEPHAGATQYGHRPALTAGGYGGDFAPWIYRRATTDAITLPEPSTPSRLVPQARPGTWPVSAPMSSAAQHTPAAEAFTRRACWSPALVAPAPPPATSTWYYRHFILGRRG